MPIIKTVSSNLQRSNEYSRKTLDILGKKNKPADLRALGWLKKNNKLIW
jgi:hypothetical protein